MRTGSIGNRDAETLFNTLVEPKRTLLANLRKKLLALGYSEETGYDAINIESFVSYSTSGIVRFLLKHKWEVIVVVVFQNSEEKSKTLEKFGELIGREIEANPDDGTMWCKLSPTADDVLVDKLAGYFITKTQ